MNAKGFVFLPGKILPDLLGSEGKNRSKNIKESNGNSINGGLG